MLRGKQACAVRGHITSIEQHISNSTPLLPSRCQQVIQLRGRMGGILNILTGMFGGGGGGIVEKADVAVEKLQGYKERMVSHGLLCPSFLRGR